MDEDTIKRLHEAAVWGATYAATYVMHVTRGPKTEDDVGAQTRAMDDAGEAVENYWIWRDEADE